MVRYEWTIFLSLADWRKRFFGPNRNLEIFIQAIDKIRSIPSKFYVLRHGNDEQVEPIITGKYYIANVIWIISYDKIIYVKPLILWNKNSEFLNSSGQFSDINWLPRNSDRLSDSAESLSIN